MRIVKVAAIIVCLLLLSLVTTICTMVESTRAQSVRPPAPEQVERLRLHVETLCEQPRHGATIVHSRNYIEEQMSAAGWEVTRQQFTTSDGESRYNICALRRGRSGKRYIIGAHYDACDTGEGPNPGADDNASAVAVLLELAVQLPSGTPLHDIELVAWDCEEPPWFDSDDMGSAHHAASAVADNVLGLICLEMLGYYSDAPGSQPSLFPGHALLLPTIGNFVAVVGNLQARPLAREIYSALQEELPAVRINIPWADETALFFSDHRNYHPLGIPSVMVTNTAMLRNSNYHKPTDTPDTLDYNRMGRVTRALSRVITSLAWPKKGRPE